MARKIAIPDRVAQLEIGDKLRLTWTATSPSNRLWYVRGIVDDCAIVRFWHRNAWRYEIVDNTHLWSWAEHIELNGAPLVQALHFRAIEGVEDEKQP